MTTSKPAAFNVAVTGVIPPTVGRARIREAFPAMPGVTPLAGLAKALTQTYVLAPLAWLLLAPFFALKFAPFVCRRYSLTNQSLSIRRGWKPAIVQEVLLADIDDVVLVGEVDTFYLSGNLEVKSGGKTLMTLAAVPEPEGFRQAVLNTVRAWVPGKAVASAGTFVPASFKG
jgi:hypothetical protein